MFAYNYWNTCFISLFLIMPRDKQFNLKSILLVLHLGEI
jgi:hypothetical protein